MSLDLYKNINDIVSEIKPKWGERFTDEHAKLLNPILRESTFGNTRPNFGLRNTQDIDRQRDQVELHVYTENNQYIGGIHQVRDWSIVTKPDDEFVQKVKLNVHDDIRELNLKRGSFKIVYNFIRNFIGGQTNPDKLFIYEISPSRRELRVRLSNPDSPYSLSQYSYFASTVLRKSSVYNDYIMNFGNNEILKVINILALNGNELLLKLYEPLPAKYDEDIEFWLGKEIVRPYVDNITLFPLENKIEGNNLAGPNFDIEVDYWTSTETGLKSWNDLLTTNADTSQKLIDNYFSGSLEGVDLNIDYGVFDNFIHFSSARERVDNFVYKLGLIESYDSTIKSLNTYTGSLGTNLTNFNELKNNVIGGFDGFENHLYYGYSSSLYTYPNTSSIVPNHPYINPFPKRTSEYPYYVYSLSSSQAISWIDMVRDVADDYDSRNYDSLANTIPLHVRDDSLNEQYELFVNMMGQHFDTVYTYIDHMTQINKREEHPNDGMSKDLLYDVAKSYGWTLTHGNQSEDLWKYTFGIESDNTMQTSGSGDFQTKSGRNRTSEVWRRIVNNLPYILKSKGTSRSIKALISCYGVPSSVLSPREYGGPATDDVTPQLDYDKFENYTKLSGNSTYVTAPWRQVTLDDGNNYFPSSIELTFRTENHTAFNYNSYGKHTLFQVGTDNDTKMMVTLEPTSSDKGYGNLHFYLSGSSGYLTASILDKYFLDGGNYNLVVQRDSRTNSDSADINYNVYLKSRKYGKIYLDENSSFIVTGSGGSVPQSYNNSWTTNNTLYLGSGSNPNNHTGFTGSILELRYWSNPLDSDVITNHTLGSRAYNGNNATASFYDLAFRIPFGNTDINYNETSSINSIHPNGSISTFQGGSPLSASVFGLTTASYEGFTNNYTVDAVSIGNQTFYSNKVRTESSRLVGDLNPNTRVEEGAYDRNPKDSNRVTVAFSPAQVMNEDILESMGGVRLDNYIGNPSDQFKDKYNDLTRFSQEYWKKYTDKNDINKYLRVFQQYDFSLFQQLKQALPYNANKILGVLIEPNLLERSKQTVTNKPSIEDVNHEVTLDYPELLELTGTNNAILTSSLDAEDMFVLESNKQSDYVTELNLVTTKVTGSYYGDNRGVWSGVINATYYTSSNYNLVGIKRNTSSLGTNQTDFGYGEGWITQSNPYWISEPTGSFIDVGRPSIYNQSLNYFYSSSVSASINKFYSSSYKEATVTDYDFLPTATQRRNFAGCKLTAPDWNIISNQTPTGDAVVEISISDGKIMVNKDFDTISGSIGVI